MSERLLFSFVVVILAALGALSACDTQSCVARGKTTSFAGTATYALHLDTGPLSAGSENTLFYTVDRDEDCSYANEEYVVEIDGCKLWVTDDDGSNSNSSSNSGDDDDDSNTPITTEATIESGQTCSISIAGGTATVAITDGHLLVGTDYNVSSFDATVSAWNGTATTGTFHLDFSGN